MKLDLLIAEIGSTTTVVNGFNGIGSGNPVFVGQGVAPTSVALGDVMIGLQEAVASLKKLLGLAELEWKEFMATSSAAGGLRMSVHGLVKDMTTNAAEEAALGAGAVIKLITSGKLRKSQLAEIRDLKPNIILLVGGVDYGEEETALYNAKRLSGMQLKVPVVYAGNIALQHEILKIFSDKNIEIFVIENVYPKIDTLQIEPARKVIQEIFARHIVHAPGMQKIQALLSMSMLPTPGAVMEAAKLLKAQIGNLLVVDVGGATTDIHSVTEDSIDIRNILLTPVPEAKRTVEGDLGVFHNAKHVYQMMKNTLPVDELNVIHPLPSDGRETAYINLLTEKAVLTAVERHVGCVRDYYGVGGRQQLAEGKDLTEVKWIIGTGGALTRLGEGIKILEKIKIPKNKLLLPSRNAQVLLDSKYIMASVGIMSKKYPEDAWYLLMQSIGMNNN